MTTVWGAYLLLIQQPLGAVQRIRAGKGPWVSDHSTKDVTTGGIAVYATICSNTGLLLEAIYYMQRVIDMPAYRRATIAST
jgi:hypothetical protein